MKRENQVGVRVPLPASFALRLEDLWRGEVPGIRRSALTYNNFMAELVGLGMEAYERMNLPQQGMVADQSPEEQKDEEEWEFQNAARGRYS